MGNGWENCAIVTVQKVVRDVSQVKIKVELKVLRTFSQYWRKKTSCKNTHQLCWIRRSCACANVNLADLKKENEWSANNKHTSDLEGPFIPVPRRKFIHKTGQVKTSTRANFLQTAETRKHCQGQVQTRSALFLKTSPVRRSCRNLLYHLK